MMVKIERIPAYYAENGVRDSIPLRDMAIVSQDGAAAGNYSQIGIHYCEHYSRNGDYVLTGYCNSCGYTIGVFPTMERAKEVLQELIYAARDGYAIAFMPEK